MGSKKYDPQTPKKVIFIMFLRAPKFDVELLLLVRLQQGRKRTDENDCN